MVGIATPAELVEIARAVSVAVDFGHHGESSSQGFVIAGDEPASHECLGKGQVGAGVTERRSIGPRGFAVTD